MVEFDDVQVEYVGRHGAVSAVERVSLELAEGETFGLVGESGCGKTTLSMALMGLLPQTAKIGGEIRFRGQNLFAMADRERRAIRGDRIGMIFQDPATSLDPTFGIGMQVAETIRAHSQASRKESKARALELLREVGIPDPEARYADPPHRLSGGMRQRVVIATAIANNPALLLADEPTSALDVTIQAQILRLLHDLQVRHGTTILLIAHDLALVAQICDRIGVMYAGQLVEIASVVELFARPAHPYTRALLDARPGAGSRGRRLRVIEGEVLDLADAPPGCRFADRCPHRMDECSTRPPLADAGDGRRVACWLHAATRRAAGLDPLTRSMIGVDVIAARDRT